MLVNLENKNIYVLTNNMQNKIIKLKPFIKNYLWGGNKLKEYGKESEDIIAESWEFSVHPDGISIVDSGDNKGRRISEVIKENHSLIGNKKDISILIKYIDANKDLSIQVHPSDEYALKHEDQLGKTEIWYVLEADKNAFLYYGLNKDSTKEEIKKRIEDGTLIDILNKVYTKPGDCFLIEPGTIHAIGAGNIICEIQENSNVTYRIFDYNRKDKDGNLRRLDIDKALDVIDLKKNNIDNRTTKGECKYFSSEIVSTNNVIQFYVDDDYQIINIIDGKGTIDEITFNKGDSFFIPSNYGLCTISGHCCFIQTKAKL